MGTALFEALQAGPMDFANGYATAAEAVTAAGDFEIGFHVHVN